MEEDSTMTRDAIRQAAMKRFAEQGFDGTSMAEIAQDVGIKAPAIYVHFKGKTELFLDLLHRALNEELAYTGAFLSRDGEAEAILPAFLEDIGRRFDTSPRMRFILNAVYLPPQKVATAASAPVDAYMNNMEITIHNVFKRLPPCRIPPEQLASAYMGIMDSLQAEALYGGKTKFLKRLDAFWQVFRLVFHS